MEFSERQQQILPVALYDLPMTRSALDDEESPGIPITRIGMHEVEQLARALGGRPEAVFFGSTILN